MDKPALECEDILQDEDSIPLADDDASAVECEENSQDQRVAKWHKGIFINHVDTMVFWPFLTNSMTISNHFLIHFELYFFADSSPF